MFDAIASVLAIAVVGSLVVPLTMCVLARFGYFEPIEFEFGQRRISFAPRKREERWIVYRPTLSPAGSDEFAPVVTFAPIVAIVLVIATTQVHLVQECQNPSSSTTADYSVMSSIDG